MFERKLTAAVLSVLLVASAGLAGVTTAAPSAQTTAEGSAYAGAHVETNVTGDALVDYRVDGTTVMESVRVQSASEADAGGGVSVGADADVVTGFAGAALSVDARTETSATVTADSGAELAVHDNGHGSLVVAADGQRQYVGLNLSESADVRTESEARAVVTHDDGTESAVLVVGNGSVAVDDGGNLTADVDADSRLVVRSYENRTEDDRRQEQLVANGTAAAQVYLTQQAEGGSQAAVDVVDYGQNTTVEVSQQAEGSVEMTVERSAERGKVVIASLNDTALDASDVAVRVDGEAAAEASSYGELAAAADGGDSSKYMVRQSASAEASAEVLVALNHFSERSVTMTDSDSGDGDSTDGDTSESDGQSTATPGDADDDPNETPSENGPGFTAILSLIALVSAAGVALWRTE